MIKLHTIIFAIAAVLWLLAAMSIQVAQCNKKLVGVTCVIAIVNALLVLVTL